MVGDWSFSQFAERTQTTIQNFLEGHGLKVGVINGDSGERNQETINLFRRKPPGYRVNRIHRSWLLKVSTSKLPTSW
jgi:hypothetical protein